MTDIDPKANEQNAQFQENIASADNVNRNRQLARSTLMVIIAFAIAKVISLGQTFIIAQRFGVGSEWDAYVAANRIPELIFTLIAGGALSHAFIPIFSGYLAKGDVKGAWTLASHVVNTIFVFTGIISIIVFLTAPWLVSEFVAPGFEPEVQAQTVEMMRILLIGTLIFSVSGIVMGILQSYNHFLLPAIAPIMFDLGILFGVIFLLDPFGIQGVALGAVFGATMHFAIQIPGLLKVNVHWIPQLGFSDPILWRVIRLMIPRVAGLGVFSINFLVMNNIASRLGEGSVSALDWGWRLMQIPQTLIGTAMGIVIFPTLAALSEVGDEDGKRTAMSGALRFILIASIPSAVGLIVIGRPLIGLLERGAFDESASTLVYSTLQFFALGLIVHSALEVVARSFYADKDTLTPLWAALGGAAINLGLSFLLSNVARVESNLFYNAIVADVISYQRDVGNVGNLALANSMGVMFEVGFLMVILRKRWHGAHESVLARTVIKTTLASLAMAMAIVIIDIIWNTLGIGTDRIIMNVGLLGIEVIVGGMVFLGTAILLKMEELQMLYLMIFRRKQNIDTLQEVLT